MGIVVIDTDQVFIIDLVFRFHISTFVLVVIEILAISVPVIIVGSSCQVIIDCVIPVVIT